MAVSNKPCYQKVVSEVSGCLLFRNWVLNTRGKWIDSHHACYCFYSDIVCVVYTPSTRMCIDVFINQNQWIFGGMGYTTNYQLNIIPAYHWISWLNVFNVRSFHKPNREHSIWVLFLMKDFDRAYSHPPFILNISQKPWWNVGDKTHLWNHTMEVFHMGDVRLHQYPLHPHYTLH